MALNISLSVCEVCVFPPSFIVLLRILAVLLCVFLP